MANFASDGQDMVGRTTSFEFRGQEREETMLGGLALPLARPQAPYPGEGEKRRRSSSANQCVTFRKMMLLARDSAIPP
jgi:hypothetical protein